MRSNLINYRKRLKLGIIGALMICQVVFMAFRWIDAPAPLTRTPYEIICINPIPGPGPCRLVPAPGAIITPRDEEPELIGGLNLKYPEWARKAGVEGKAYVYALINIDGKVTEAKIFKSSGYEVLDQAAIQAIKESRWHPARQDDDPVGVWVVVPVMFSLSKTNLSNRR